MVILIVKIIVAIIFGILAGHGVVYLMNHIPAAWLCDYDEDPYFVDHPAAGIQTMQSDADREWEAKYGIPQRIKSHPWKLALSAVFSISYIWLILGKDLGLNFAHTDTLSALATVELSDMCIAFASMLALFLLALIGISDHKYMIIPDQFSIMLAFCGIGFLPYHLIQAEYLRLGEENASFIAAHGYMSPILGALAAAGTFLAIAVLSKLCFKQDSLGLGDVKLMLSIGLILGIYNIVGFIILTAFIAAIAGALKLITKKLKATDHQPLGDIISLVCAFYILFVM